MLENDALAELYRRYGYLVHRRCLAIVQDGADADDALQEVFLRVRRYGDTERGGSTLAWLYAISFRVCCDQLDRRRKEPPSTPDALAALELRSVGSGEDAERRALLGGALRAVGPKTREIAVLHFLDGMTQEETAAASGYSRKTVGKKLHAFVSLLKSRWEARRGLG